MGKGKNAKKATKYHLQKLQKKRGQRKNLKRLTKDNI